MVEAAAVVSGGGAELQSLIDGLFFGEIPGFSLAALVSAEGGGEAAQRVAGLGVGVYTVDASIFPNSATFTRALTAKLQDIDADIAILVTVRPEPGEELYRAYSGRCVCLRLSRSGGELRATALLADADGSEARRFGRVSVEPLPGESEASLRRRLVENGAGELLTGAVKDFMRDFH